MATQFEILRILDKCCLAYTFPMFDNGYIYPAASRLSAYHSPDNWALVFELFGFSPRAGLPDTTIITFADSLSDRNPENSYVSADAYKNYIAHNPHNEDRRFWPLAEGAWMDADDCELMSANVADFVLRGRTLKAPEASEYNNHGIELSERPRIMVFEFCRWLGANFREDTLATASERRVSLDPSLQEILVLDDWNHPDLAGGVLASHSETFQQLARVLATGDADFYRPTTPHNTHWRNWPEGGTL